MSGSLQARWPAVALALSIAIAGCGGSHGDNEVSQAAHAGLETMQAAGVGHLQAGEARDVRRRHLAARRRQRGIELNIRQTQLPSR